MSDSDTEIDWSKTTFDGARREQLRRWHALTVRQRLEALDAMSDLAQRCRQAESPLAPDTTTRRR